MTPVEALRKAIKIIGGQTALQKENGGKKKKEKRKVLFHNNFMI